MRNPGEIRIGFVGAGEVTRKRHIPGLLAIPGVKLVAVCNRRRESSSKVSRDFNIPLIFDAWEDLVADERINAIVIGAWPHLHCGVTLEALRMGKHVLTQARMAMNAREAQRMLDSSREHPDLAAMVVPSPYGLAGEAFVKKLIADGYLGTLREVHAHHFSNSLADSKAPLGWRQIAKYSGYNTLYLGILHETVLRWVPSVSRLFAAASRLIPVRKNPETGEPTKVGTADSVQVITEQEGGSRGLYRLSGVVWHEQGMGVSLFGSRGTIVYDLDREIIRAGKAREPELKPLSIPDELRGGWNVEADFVAAIRGEKPVTHTDFLTGARYMQFTEAVARSSRHQLPVTLPLRQFSNPSL